MNGRAEIQDGRFQIGGRPFYVYSGEIHYFRVHPRDWPHRLAMAKKAGLNTVSSYIPWRWHEPSEGRFDFTGRTHPARNLIRWLDAVRKSGLRFIARVGPISNAELIREGLPDWLLDKYHEVHLEGKPLPGLPHVTIVAYRSPVFLDKVSRWYSALLPLLFPYHHSRGGPIVLTQLCNEIGMVHWLNRAADYSPRAESAYREFLKSRYGGLSQLNLAWKSSFQSWDSVRQPKGTMEKSRWAECVDWSLFYRDYYGGYYAILTQFAGRHGVGGPYIANIPQFWDYDVRGRGTPAVMTSTLFRDFQKKVGDPVILGGAYQMRRLDVDNFHDIEMATESVNLQHPNGDVPSICAELQTGIMRDRPRLYGSDVELNLKSSTACGLAGVNGYMFCAGESPDGMGAFGRYHEWQAAVDSRGRTRPHFAEMARFGRWVSVFESRLPNWRKADDVALGVYFPYLANEYWRGEWVDRLVNLRDRLWFDGLARLLLLNNYHFRFIDISRSQDMARFLAAGLPDSLWVFTTETLDAETQRRLVGYVSAGGKLMLGPWMPEVDLAGRPCRILAKALGVSKVEELDEKCAQIGPVQSWFDGNLIHAASKKAQPVIKSVSGKPVAWLRKLGRGQALFCGIPLQHTFDPAIHAVRILARSLGVSARLSADTDGELPLVWRGDDREGVLLAPNYHDRPIRAKIHLRQPAFRSGNLVLPPRKAYLFPVGVEIADGLRLDATGELLGVRTWSRDIVLTFDFPAGRNLIRLSGKPASVTSVSAGRLFRMGGGRFGLDFTFGEQDARRNDVTVRIRL